MQKWIDFKNKRYKCSRILQDLQIFFQNPRKYSQKGLLVTLFPVVAKNSFFMKNCFFQKHQLGIPGRKWAEIGQKMDFRALSSEIYMKIEVFSRL